MIEHGTLDEAANANELLKIFFIADAIDPNDFLANYVDISGETPVKAPIEAGKPTRSAASFEKGANAPPGYPRWFLAAYPEVVLWLAAKDESSMIRTTAEALYGFEGAKELVRIHGLKRIAELMEEKFEDFDLSQLRRLVTCYTRDTRKKLECAMIVKEKRAARRWLEAPPKRQRASALSQRVLSDFD